MKQTRAAAQKELHEADEAHAKWLRDTGREDISVNQVKKNGVREHLVRLSNVAFGTTLGPGCYRAGGFRHDRQ